MPADRDFYLERLYPMQDRILARLAPIENDFSLTGGTAAFRAYLHHRFSDDLDFFVIIEPGRGRPSRATAGAGTP